MRRILAVGVLLAFVGCAASSAPPAESSAPPAEEWRRVDGSPADLDQLRADETRCLNRARVASPGSRSPAQATRDDLIDCMRTKGWVRR